MTPKALMNPSPFLLCSLASIAVHADELFSADGRTLDKDVLLLLLADPEVKAWIAEMTKCGLAPVKRLR